MHIVPTPKTGLFFIFRVWTMATKTGRFKRGLNCRVISSYNRFFFKNTPISMIFEKAWTPNPLRKKTGSPDWQKEAEMRPE
jgi:hypothetical protein